MSKNDRRSKNRRANLERLENRNLLAADLGEWSKSFWTDVDSRSLPSTLSPAMKFSDYRLAELNVPSIQSQLAKTPNSLELSPSNDNVLSIPTPDGGFERFQLYVSSIMAPELAAKFPDIHTYAGQGLDNPASTVVLDMTPQGFHAQVRKPSGTYYVDPFSQQSNTFYAVYDRNSLQASSTFQALDTESLISDVVAKDNSVANPPATSLRSTESRSGTQLRTYRLALAATGEYTAFHGGTVAAGQAAIVTAVNRVAGIYQTEATISFQLVANNDKLVYTNANTDPYTNNDGFTMLGENQANIDSVIGNANYDIGHVFSTGGGGVASLGSVGVDSVKAEGVTGLDQPIGDAFWVDYVAHEMGHQFGGNHTFNSSAGSCGGGNRNASTAYEPGSGVSIQAYAGICGSDDLQPHSIPYFHSASLDEFMDHVDGAIPNVGTRTNTGNSIPTVSGGADYTIPARTPFVLTATGSDANAGDQLTYDWQERDLGPTQPLGAADNKTSPLFREWEPTVDPSRTFPRLSDLVNNTLALGEQLPTTNRNANFRVTVRDNRVAGGAFDTDDVKLTVIDTGESFKVLTPNTNVSWEALTIQTVTWNVAGTTANGINASKVDISLSADGGFTYPFKLALGVPNSGSADVRIPNLPTNQARIRVQGNNNVFFDISDTNFTVTPASKVIDINLGGASAFTEDSLPQLITPNAVVTTAGVNSFSGGTLRVEIGNNYEVGDEVNILSEGTLAGQISVDSNNSIQYAGVPIGTYTTTASSLLVTFGSAADLPSINALMRRLTFHNSSNGPSANFRTVTAYLDNGLEGASNLATVLVDVIPVNDAPEVGNASLASVNEDTASPTGETVGNLVSPSFRDVDKNSSLSGVVIVGNTANPLSGRWEFLVSGNTWRPVGSVSLLSGLVVSAKTRLRYVPTQDFFGPSTPLVYRGLDDSYAGAFTDVTRVTLDVSVGSNIGPFSLASQTISTSIIPVNDPPVAQVPAQFASTLQDVELSFLIPPNWFADVDNATLSISATTIDGQPLPKWLSYDPTTSVLSGTPANDDVGIFNLAIRATDSAGASAIVPLTVNAINVNDAPTDIIFNSTAIRENSPAALVGSLFARDPDSGDSFKWSVTDPRFEVRGNILYLSPSSSLDFEKGSQVSVLITVTDNGSPPRSFGQQKIVTVLDENEFAPELTATKFSVSEGLGSQSVIGTVTAIDKDTSNTVRFRFVGTPPTMFTLNSNDGTIRLTPDATLDYETQSSYQFFVEAFDDGLPTRATTASVNVQVNDVNEYDPIITNNTIVVPENQSTNVAFYRVQASDKDTSQQITYQLPPTETRFNINSSTGELSLRQGGIFDFETSNRDSVVVIATDSGTPARSSRNTFAISITDANDPPTAVAITNGNVLSNVSDAFIGKILVTDQDVGQQYSITSLDDRFIVVNGNLLVAPGKSVGELDPLQMSIPVSVVELGQGSKSYPLSIALNRTPNLHPWQNRLNPLDVDRSGDVGPLDVLAIVNGFNAGFKLLEQPRPFGSLSLPDYDVDGDGSLTPLDALVIVNLINNKNSGGAEGESAGVELAPPLAHVDSGTWISAYLQIENEEVIYRRKRG